jgi:hypothetical protein
MGKGCRIQPKMDDQDDLAVTVKSIRAHNKLVCDSQEVLVYVYMCVYVCMSYKSIAHFYIVQQDTTRPSLSRPGGSWL